MTELENKSEEVREEAGGLQGDVSADSAGGISEEVSVDAEIETMREQLRQTEDRLLRMAAEFENTKKRMQRDRETAIKFAEENLIKEILPSIDNLQRALEQGTTANDVASVLEGVEMTCNGLLGILEKNGLMPIDGVGEAFDPNFHEALAMEPSDDYPANTIIREFQRGYIFRDKLIRAAKVIVSSGKAGQN